MSEWKLMLNESDVMSLQIILRQCKADFIRDKKIGREPVFNELTLLEALKTLGIKSWSFGNYKQGEENEA